MTIFHFIANISLFNRDKRGNNVNSDIYFYSLKTEQKLKHNNITK